MNRWDRYGLCFSLVMIGMVVLGLTRIRTNTEDVLQWLPDQSVARQDFNFFRQHFQSDDFVILTWDGCTTQDPRLPALSKQIRDQTMQSQPDGDPPLVVKVTSGLDMTRDLSKQLEISRQSVMRRLRGVFFGVQDIERTCVLVELSRYGGTQRAEVIDAIYDSIDSIQGLDRRDVSLAGYPYIATYISQQLSGSYRTLLIPSIVFATIISLLCLRNWTLGAIVFATATGASAASVAITPLCGYQLGGLMSIIPALVFVLATSGAIHLIRYSLDVDGDPNLLIKVGWKPCVISTTTTAIGMLSLLRSEFPAIRNFGLFCAVGVCFALAFQLTLVPWLLHRFGQSGLNRLRSRQQASNFWLGLAEAVKRRRLPITIVFVSALAVGFAGLNHLTAQVEVEKLFRPGSSIINSLTAMETTLGPMDQTELLVIFDDLEESAMYQRADYVAQLQREIKKSEQVEVAYSLVNFLPAPPKKRQSARSFLKRAAYREYIDKNRQLLAENNQLAIDDATGREIWRITIRFPFIAKVDFEAAKNSVIDATDRIAEKYRSQLPSEFDPTIEGALLNNTNAMPSKVVYTGQIYLFHHAQLRLLKDLFQNFVLAFVIITPILVIVLRSIKIGLLAMLPNVFPTVVVFGLLGWVGTSIDMALAMTACVALGIAVDDTTHFLIRFREFGGNLQNPSTPVKKTIAQCGPAMWHTTLIASASLLTFYFSEMLVVSRFSWAISSLLAVALLADVLMLPALLLLMGNPQTHITGDD